MRGWSVRRGAAVLALVASQVLPAAMPAGVVAAPAALPRPAGVVRAGFTDTLVTSNVVAPVAVTALPDGRAVVLEKFGAVRVLHAGVLSATPALRLTVCTDSERGLLGFAPDPAFGANGFVYVYYTRPSESAPGGCVNRVSRFTMRGDTIARTSEVVLLDNIGSPRGNHNGGDVAIGNDGFLYVSVGDGGCSPRDGTKCAGSNGAAQDRSLLNGKILRVNRTTGAPAAGNPFTGAGTAVCRTRGNTPSTPTTTCREIFAYGLRNPWRFAFDPNTGGTRFFINDVGQNTREEVDLGTRGANYGWPKREGRCAQGVNPPCTAAPAAYTRPLTDYQHGVTGEYITGGAFVPKGAWGKAYDGGYLFADGNPGSIFFRGAGGTVNYAVPFATGVAGVADIEMVMDPTGWSLYYVLPGANEVRRIRPQAVAAVATGNLAYTVVAPRRVFDSRALGAASGPLSAGTSRLVNVVTARGVHRAALVNVTALSPSSAGTLAVWLPRTTRPGTTNVVVTPGQATSNAVVAPLDADGNVLLHTTATTDVTIDVVGFFDLTTGGRATAGRFAPLAPARAADTRRPVSATNVFTRTPDGAQSVVNVPLVGRLGVPAGTRAVALMVLAVGAGGTGGVVVHPHGGAVPAVASLATNGAGDVRTNLVVVPVGVDGSVDLRLRGVTHVAVDVLGTFTGASAASSSRGTYVAMPARRTVDTRRSVGFASLPTGATGTVNPVGVPDSAIAVTQNVAMVAPVRAGTLVAYPSGITLPAVTNVATTAAGQTRSAATITRLGAGAERIRTSASTDVVVDVSGWFNG